MVIRYERCIEIIHQVSHCGRTFDAVLRNNL